MGTEIMAFQIRKYGRIPKKKMGSIQYIHFYVFLPGANQHY